MNKIRKTTLAILLLVFIVGCGTSTKRTPSYTTTEGQTEEITTQVAIEETTTEEESTTIEEETTTEEESTTIEEETTTEEESTTIEEETTTEEESTTIEKETTTEEESTTIEEETTTEEESTIIEEEITTEEESTTTEEETTTIYKNEISILGTVRVGSLKGPTSMGLVAIMDAQEKGQASLNYEFTMVTAADELMTMVATGNVDIALLPANVASVLYKRTNGNVMAIDINTLGVLYIVEGGNTIKSIEDLKGKTIYMTGKGTTPEYCIRYLLTQHGLTEDDVTLEFKSEATEVAAIIAKTEGAIGLLPQPFVTTAMTNNSDLRIALDLTKEWDKVADSSMVTGVTIVQKSFLEQQPEAVETFLADHQYSVAAGNADLEKTAERIEHFGIIKAPIAQKAYPYCNIVCITGDEMQRALSGYLNVLYEQNPSAIGGTLPDDGFYY